ncbi:MAG: hydantoinase/oxoprolinase family protein [Acidimicrobiia bacterium]|nr:hydantoinase/oxoprolinase family protein [Acidimicrobiia bacterium]
MGGTFTDVAMWDGTAMTVGKVPSTPRDQSEGVMAGARAAVPAGGRADLLHGTTVATNALLERRGARTLLVTDAGFESLIEIARQDRPSLYDPFADRSAPLADPGMRLGVDVPAVGHDGELDAVAASVAAAAHDRGAEAVALCLMYSYADPTVERALADRLRRVAGVPVSASAEVVAEFREYERFSTAVLNAFLSPEVSRYVGSLADRAGRAGFIDEISVMRSSGGLVSLDHSSAFPASILLSGPAGGVVAAAALGELMECETLISFDMGGTSTDVCRVRSGRPEVTYSREIAGHACLMPSVAVHTVGAGGGSVAWADRGGALRVGPRSAGADPGPACYDRGGAEPTVTDANVVLGRLDTRARLAGTLALQPDPAMAAFERLGSELSLESVDAALGVVAVVESHMTHAVRAVSVEQGTDPRDAALMAFGGAGGLHACALARALAMDGVIVPPYAGVFSAFGLLLSPPRADAAQTVNVTGADRDRLPAAARSLLAEARGQIEADSGQMAETAASIVDMRYVGQAHETSVPYTEGEPWEALCERFHRLHARRNGFSRPLDPVEAVTARAEAVGSAALRWADLPAFEPEPGDPGRGSRPVIGPAGTEEAQVWWRPALPVGAEVSGPAIIAEGESTTYLAGDERAIVHETGALRIEW